MTPPRPLPLILIALAACAPVAPPVAPPSLATPPPATVAPAAAPPPAAQVFADDEPAYGFADPRRREKLASAFGAIDALVDAELLKHDLPGLALGVVIDGELSHFRGAGVTDLGTRVAPDADTVFRIGSITKSFTGLATVALRDDGALGLDDPLVRLVPEAAALVYPTHDSPPLTLHQLVTHTSGLPRLGAFNYVRSDAEPSEDEVLRSLSGFHVLNAPGRLGLYSNLGFALLGIAVGRAAHVPLRTFVGRRLFTPLGMSSSTFDPPAVPGRLATGYEKSAPGPNTPTTLWRLGASEGAGGIFSTVRDMARYVAFQLDAYPPRSGPDAGTVRRSSVRETHQGALHHDRFEVSLREDAASGESLVTAASHLYGYGWVREESCDFDEHVWHDGSVDGYSSAVSFLPQYGVGVVALSNRSAGGPTGVDLEPLAARVLRALTKTGGLSPRVARVALSPAFAPALTRLLAVYETWNEDAYKAMLSTERQAVPPESERGELAGYHALHGACTGSELLEASSPRSARFALRCERGSLEMAVTIDGAGLIRGFSGTSRDIPIPPATARAAGRVAGLLRKWDDAVYRKVLGATPGRSKAERKVLFAGLHAAHGTCTPTGYTRTFRTEELTLRCEHGGDLRLKVALDGKDPDALASIAIAPRNEDEACPLK